MSKKEHTIRRNNASKELRTYCAALSFSRAPLIVYLSPESKAVALGIDRDANDAAKQLLSLKNTIDKYAATGFTFLGVCGYRDDFDEIFYRTAPGMENSPDAENALLGAAVKQYVGPQNFYAMLANPEPFLKAADGGGVCN